MYKNYNMSQLTLPIETEITFPENDVSTIINHLVESIPDAEFNDYYNHRGPSSYHPKMMLKILLYSYSQSVFSGRKIEFLLKDSCRLMWLAQGQTPSYRTINRFRVNTHMMGILQTLFVGFRAQLIEDKLISEDVVYIDGTKLEANANKYTFQWLANTERFSQSVVEKSNTLYETLVAEEIIPEIKKESSEELSKEEMNQIETYLENKEKNLTSQIENTANTQERKTLRKQRSQIKKSKKAINDFRERKIKYENQKEIYGDRKSYSTTDHDATFMRMKDDHMKNGQLKPGYNLQIATNNQFILAYGVYNKPGDTRTLEPFLNEMKELYGDIPEYIVADAGYGSESNYKMILDDFEKTPLITYGMYIKEGKKKFKNDPFISANWQYNELDDYYLCPNNKELHFFKYRIRHDYYGYRRDFKEYRCEDCFDCPLRSKCMKQTKNPKTNKKLLKNFTWEYLKNYTKQLLSDPKMNGIYKKRKIDVESVFGNLKANLGFKRLSVRTQSKVECEIGIALMALNIRKLAR
ncbi:IS1182 family transposase [Staphylococcus hyicus]|uniref:IS1182 family transposase n=1 Tax=Staphylococcus hyicus TaxID=1284 RepID=UPI00208E8046|nr:IS1182 family transposase [Staphylococcus hyicus]MCO4333117.1 IS1182 family transposase [Staphylococcus hyicus]MCO4334186.1 IS1182 family transposase [Staphylococcus hyicus]MCO4334783.1 IS1182 family transposase [Staphylococcus hyicus]